MARGPNEEAYLRGGNGRSLRSDEGGKGEERGEVVHCETWEVRNGEEGGGCGGCPQPAFVLAGPFESELGFPDARTPDTRAH